MPKGYRHLTYDKRCQIYALLKSGCAKTEIAQLIGVHRSTITKELKRNTGGKGYRYIQAQEKAAARRAAASGAPRKMKPGLVREIEEKLTQEQWSPDQISGWLKRQGRAFVSCERIYRHIWKDKRNGGDLWRHLRHSGKKYSRRKGRNSGRGLIPGRVDIAEWPAIVAEKRRIGDWEGDAIIGRSLKGAILTHVDRTSKYTKLAILPNRSAASVQKACDVSLLPIAHKIKTITYDNGKEFAGHAQIAAKLAAQIYFAKPYHSWERGLNEHTNGLVRQYFPKGSDFSTLATADVQRVEDKLNSRPRKVLGYKTPSEVFFAAA
ncbi:MAG: IS30 family transposase [Rhodomicrobium sp.]